MDQSVCLLCESQRVCAELCLFLHYTHIRIFSNTHTRATYILITPTNAEINTATRQRQDLVNTGQLPMMHCKFNVSSSSFLHQSQAISGLVWSAQSNRIPFSPDRLVSFRRFTSWQNVKIHKLVSCSLYLRDSFHLGWSGKPKVLYLLHTTIMIEGACTVWENDAVWHEAELLCSGTCKPSRYVLSVSHYGHITIQLTWHRTVTVIYKDFFCIQVSTGMKYNNSFAKLTVLSATKSRTASLACTVDCFVIIQ